MNLSFGARLRLLLPWVVVLVTAPLSAQGVVTTAVSGNHDEVDAIAIQGDGKIVVAGFTNNGGSDDDFLVMRYNADLTLDSSFDGDGIVITAFGGGVDRANAVVVQSDGKIVVAGHSDQGGTGFDFALARYNQDGSLDTTFSGDGRNTTDFGFNNEDQARGVAIQPSDGKIVVAGWSHNGTDYDFALARYNTTDGNLDTSFDTDGMVTTSMNGGNDKAETVAIQSSGEIVVAGDAANGGPNDIAVARYDSSGNLDTTFDTDGRVITDIAANEDNARFLVIQPSDGKIVVAGSTDVGPSFDFAVLRYDPNGALDTSFDGDGIAVTPLGGGDDFGFRAALQDDGKIVVAGVSLVGGNLDFGVARYDAADGSLDASFDTDGIVTTPILSSHDWAYGVAVQADGQIVVAGTTDNGSDYDVALARYCPNGALVANYSGSFGYRKSITVNAFQVSGGADLTDFPVLISMTDADLATTGNGGKVERSDGADIVFRASCGGPQLDHEIEKYVDTTGEIIVWVRVPTVHHDQETVLFMEYGSTTVGCTTENSGGVWGSHAGVWHLSEDPSGAAPQIYDSTLNNNDGTSGGAMTLADQVPGKINGSLDFDAVDDEINLGSGASLDNLATSTWEAWIYPTGWGEGGFGRILFKDPVNADHRGLYVTSAGELNFTIGWSGSASQFASWRSPASSLSLNMWQHVAITYDYSSPANDPVMYIDGVSQSVSVVSAPAGVQGDDSAVDLRIGNRNGGDRTFQGFIDEVRVAEGIRSAAWIQTAVNNQDSPGSFFTVGYEQSGPFCDWVYGYRKKLSIDNTKVTCGSDLSNFAVLISLVDPDLRLWSSGGKVENANGHDILFRAADGQTTLFFEYEFYDPTTGTLVAWVGIPTLLAASDTDIYMYYGNRDVLGHQSIPTGVWDSNFKAVWHLKENPETSAPQFLDSTSNTNDGTANSLTSANQVPGEIDGSLQFDGSSRFVDVADHASLDLATDMTVSAWVKTDNMDLQANIVVAKWDTPSSSRNYWLGKLDATNFGFVVDGSESVTFLLNLINDDTWHHVVGVADAPNSLLRIYVDGNEENTAAYDGTSSETGTSVLRIGVSPDQPTQLWTGGIDETRISDTVRTACSIETEYNSQSFPTKNPACSDGGFICVGAEESGPPTAVRLTSLTANGGNKSVLLEWETASELDNLGFHLYRSRSEEGPYERVTATLIPGLGSSPQGAHYAYRDSGLVNGVTYYYELEDIETTGLTELHGPVSATPTGEAGVESEEALEQTTSEELATSLITYGDPSANSLQVLQRGSAELVVELVTEGFYAEPQDDGTVRLEVPGFEVPAEATGVEIPLKRAWVDVLAGRKVKLVSVQARDVEAFTSLRPRDAELAELEVSREGTVRAARRAARKAFRGAGLEPASEAQVVSVGFQGEDKRALIELAPLRWDETQGELLLARRLVVRLSLREREPTERVLADGVRGRGYQRRRSHAQRKVVARFETTLAGLYGVSYEEVMRGRRGVPAQALRLSRQGETVAFHLEPRGRRFEPGSWLYFVSEGAGANPYGNEAVYELEVGASGEVMAEVSASPSGESHGVYWHRSEWEEDRYYQSGLVDAPERWLWDLVFAPQTKSYLMEVSGLASSGDSAKLDVWLQGASDFPASSDHHVRVYVNGSLVDEQSWDGKQARRFAIELPPGLLIEGDNALELWNVGDTEALYSMVMLDRYAVEYPRLAQASDGRLEGRWSGPGTAELSGFVAGTHVLDVSDAAPRWLVDTELGADAQLRFAAEAERSYLAVSPEAVYRAQVTRAVESHLKNKRNRADYLVIAPVRFLEAATPLLELRESAGLHVRAVAVEEIYAEFGFGEPTPEAVKDFLSYAFHYWREPSPRYVVLLGDATFDYKDHLGTGVTNQVPPRIVKTTYLWTSSDPSYAAVNGEDILPDFAIGRLPAATLEEARVLVDKIVAYETDEVGVSAAPVVLVADNPDEAGDFEADANALADGVLQTRAVEKIYLSELGKTATRAAIVEAFDAGASLVSYLGHGGIHLWADENVFNISDAPSLSPRAQQPVLLTMNCLNGYFHFPYFASLGEALVKAEGKGAIAAFSPSGLSLNAPANRYHEAILTELLSGHHQRLGDAVLAAQSEYAASGAFPELLSIYHLLGDPALTLR